MLKHEYNKYNANKYRYFCLYRLTKTAKTFFHEATEVTIVSIIFIAFL